MITSAYRGVFHQRHIGTGAVEPAAKSPVSAFQAEILDDGDVSIAEYERAVSATVGSLRESRHTVFGPVWTFDGLHYLYTFAGGNEDGSADAECSAQYLSEVKLAWSDQVAPTEGERQAAAAEFAECLRADGVEGAEDGINAIELIDLWQEASTQTDRLPPYTVTLPSELMGEPDADQPDITPLSVHLNRH